MDRFNWKSSAVDRDRSEGSSYVNEDARLVVRAHTQTGSRIFRRRTVRRK